MIANRTIRRATVNDVQEVLHLIDSGRKIMIASDNTYQWDDNHPSRGQIAKDIANGDSCLLLEDGMPIATWAFAKGPEPTYAVIYNGAWLDDRPYHVIHRVASLQHYHGVIKDLIGVSQRTVIYVLTHTRITPSCDIALQSTALLTVASSICRTVMNDWPIRNQWITESMRRLSFGTHQYCPHIRSLDIRRCRLHRH